MKTIFSALFFALIFLFSNSCQTQGTTEEVKYVFLFIGDGMGVNQVYATELYKGAIENTGGPKKLNFSEFPVRSWVTTYSANSLITCSAAAGSAIATGHKTNNGVLSKDTSLSINHTSISEKAKQNGFKVGIVSSVSIDHATPASFYTHQNSRKLYYEISMDLPNSNFDYFGGGGFEYPKGQNDSLPDAYENVRQKGYNLVNTTDKFYNLKHGDEKVYVVNPKTYPQGEFFWAIDKVDSALRLADFTKKGIELLDNPKGFFMMVEGGKIDWACHGNDLASAIHETLEFEAAIQQAIDFYTEHPNETIIIVTADHETGGLGLGNESPLDFGILQHQKISMQEFQRLVTRLKQNKPQTTFNEFKMVLQQYFGFDDTDKGIKITPAEWQIIQNAFNSEFAKESLSADKFDYLNEDEMGAVTKSVIAIMSKKAGVGWTLDNHTGMPVPLYAIGAGQMSFTGPLDNTDISKIIGRLMGME